MPMGSCGVFKADFQLASEQLETLHTRVLMSQKQETEDTRTSIELD
jgi:hypothetical protein